MTSVIITIIIAATYAAVQLHRTSVLKNDTEQTQKVYEKTQKMRELIHYDLLSIAELMVKKQLETTWDKDLWSKVLVELHEKENNIRNSTEDNV